MAANDRGSRRGSEDRPAGAVTHVVSPGIGAAFIGGLLRLARLRSRKAGAEEDAGDANSPRGRRPDQGSGAARSPMDAGLTRGASLLFGELRSRR
jgi:hypothetical protein